MPPPDFIPETPLCLKRPFASGHAPCGAPWGPPPQPNWRGPHCWLWDVLGGAASAPAFGAGSGFWRPSRVPQPSPMCFIAAREALALRQAPAPTAAAQHPLCAQLRLAGGAAKACSHALAPAHAPPRHAGTVFSATPASLIQCRARQACGSSRPLHPASIASPCPMPSASKRFFGGAPLLALPARSLPIRHRPPHAATGNRPPPRPGC